MLSLSLPLLSLPLRRRRSRITECAQAVARPGVQRPAAAKASATIARDAFFSDPARVESDYERLTRRGHAR
jgi:hypothetical protein